MSRAVIVTLQGAVVGVLLVVIYLTILRPTDDNSVSGVNGPGGVPPIATTAPQRPHHPKPAHHRRAHHQPQRHHAAAATGISSAGGGAPPAAVAAAPPAPAGGSVPTSSPSTSPGPGHSPTDDQYNSTLARLRAALR
jgi:hypothetical protein